MAGDHRRMRREHAFFAHGLNVIAVRHLPPGALSLFIQQLQRKQTRMAFVHMVAGDLLMTEGAQHAHAADAENHFLAEPVMAIAAVEIVRQRPIPLGILRQIAVEKIDRHRKISGTLDGIFPGAQSDHTALDGHRYPLRQLRQKVVHRPTHWLFNLPPAAVEALEKIAFAVE